MKAKANRTAAELGRVRIAASCIAACVPALVHATLPRICHEERSAMHMECAAAVLVLQPHGMSMGAGRCVRSCSN